jgi:hypothetical protein
MSKTECRFVCITHFLLERPDMESKTIERLSLGSLGPVIHMVTFKQSTLSILI